VRACHTLCKLIIIHGSGGRRRSLIINNYKSTGNKENGEEFQQQADEEALSRIKDGQDTVELYRFSMHYML